MKASYVMPAQRRRYGAVACAETRPSTMFTPQQNAREVTRRKQVIVVDSKQIGVAAGVARSEEHTSELQSPEAISYAVFCDKGLFVWDGTKISYSDRANNIHEREIRNWKLASPDLTADAVPLPCRPPQPVKCDAQLSLLERAQDFVKKP